MIQFSKRAQVADEPSEYSCEVERLKQLADDLCDLTVSNPTQAGLPYETAQILESLSESASLSYSPTPLGLTAARNSAASLWASRNVSVAPDQILLTSGTSEAYGYLFKLLCDPGDEVLVPEPSYPLFSELARYDAVTLKPYRLGFDGSFYIDFDAIERARGPRTKALIAVSPNNPTGTYVKEDEWRRLFALGLPVISDEVFSAYTLGGVRPPSALDVAQTSGAETLVFVLDGLSKYAALPQIKVSWITASGPRGELDRVMRHLEFIADAYLSVNVAAQLALPRLLQVSHTTRNAILMRINRNLACAQARTAGSPVSVLPVEGGWSAPLRLPSFSTDSEWSLGILEQCQVLTQPGWFYDFDEAAVLVLSLLTPEAHFEQGVSKLVAYAEDQARRATTPKLPQVARVAPALASDDAVR